MSIERVDQLHQQASEHYLQGEYPQAIAAWQELLEIDPANEQALEGVRMSSLLSANVTEARPEDDIDLGLRVFDSIPKPPGLAPQRALSPNDTLMMDRGAVEGMLRGDGQRAGEHEDILAKPPADVMHQVPGLDFGDLDALAPIPLAALPVVDAPAPGSVDSPETARDEEGEAVGLAPIEDERRSVPRPASASAELVNRVRDLLLEANAKADAGEREEALAILSRVYILDEENADARALEARLELAAGAGLEEIETHLIEGVQAFDQGRHEEGKVHFRAVLAAHPGHREALHYLEKIREQEASYGDVPEDLLAAATTPAPVAPPSDEESLPAIAPEVDPVPRPRRAVSPETAEPAIPAPPRRSFALSPKMLAAALGVVFLGAAAWFVPKLFSSSGTAESPAEVSESPSPRRANPEQAPSPAKRAPSAAVPSAPPMTLDQAMTKGRRAMAQADYGAAVIAFKAALDVDKTNLEALDGIRTAGEAYKAERAEQEQFDRVAMAFQSGEYASGLRLLYRLPPTIDPGRVERCKVDGWFNLGVVALRAGDVVAASGHFEDALAIRPDVETTKWRSFAQRYRDLPKDRGFYDAVEAIPFRQIH